MNEIDKAAREYIDSKFNLEMMNDTNKRLTIIDHTLSFKAGHNFALSMASKGISYDSLNDWVNCTGLVTKNTSYYFEIQSLLYEAWQAANQSQFWLLMAYRHGDKSNVKRARDYLAIAVAVLDAALADQPEVIAPAPIRVEA